MGGQESMFSPDEETEKQPVPDMTYWPHTINNDPREQASTPEQPWQPPLAADPAAYDRAYEDGYASSQASMGEKLRPQQSKLHEKWIYLLIGIAIGIIFASSFATSVKGLIPLIFLVIGAVAVWVFTGKSAVAEEPARSFSVQHMAGLVIHNPVGSLHIHRGEASSIVVKATKRTQGRFARIEDLNLVYIQEGDQLTIRAENNAQRAGASILSGIDLDIAVPHNCDIQVHQHVGSIELDGIDGQLQIKMNVGSVEARNVILRRQSRISNNIGTFKLLGELDPIGTYACHTNIGDIQLHLPSTSAFEVHSHTNIGSLENQFASNVVGDAPRARLNTHVNIGAVNIYKN
ncbi:hypothetical protein [Dictyobacter formicarum]|uniref:Adhesin domain-containing protein n=1 Tax=Dictyobacter formicarum TaxID=2778368 RepID=A0ABQ3VD77_9CHLR|nr:hypothetical protein [Dictyobacter formicarum]GHO83661.1 hypothetical protein KSZ_16670 [Dictyobacter formicarum]